MTSTPSFRVVLVALALLAAACTEMKEALKPSDPGKAASPQVTEAALRDRARDQLATGIKQYEAGDYDAAVKSLSGSLDHGLLAKTEQSTARKYLAFIHCVSGREAACRDEFRKAFEIDRDFSLGPAEDGHPAWGPVYRDVRTQLVMEREATQAAVHTGAALSRPQQLLAEGMVKYSAGDYDAAIKLLESSLKDGLAENADKVRAMKHIAFSLCLKERYRECRAAFVKIYEVDRDFDLTPAEVGHPSWSKTFAAAKAQAKKAIANRDLKEAREKAARDKAVARAKPDPAAKQDPSKKAP